MDTFKVVSVDPVEDVEAPVGPEREEVVWRDWFGFSGFLKKKHHFFSQPFLRGVSGSRIGTLKLGKIGLLFNQVRYRYCPPKNIQLSQSNLGRKNPNFNRLDILNNFYVCVNMFVFNVIKLVNGCKVLYMCK